MHDLSLPAPEDEQGRPAHTPQLRKHSRGRLHPPFPWKSLPEADRNVVAAVQNLADGDLTPVCEKIFSIYYFSNDTFDVGYFPSTPRETREVDRFQEHCQRILYPCLGLISSEQSVLSILHERLKYEPGDAALNLSLGLILSRSQAEEERRHALEILDRLAQANQVSRAEGYAALARLRHEAGSAKGALAALEKCRQRTRRPQVCPRPTELSTRQPHIPPPPPLAEENRIPVF